MKTTMKIVTICVICAAMSGCVEPVDHLSTPAPVMHTPTPEIVPVTPTPTPILTVSNDSVVIVMDISGSMRDSEIISESGVSFLDYEKRLVITILGENEFRDDYVGVVGFGSDAYTISTLACFENESTRESLKDTIRTIAPTGQLTTPLEDGLSMAEEMLANSAGAKDVIILSDGNKIDYGSSLSIATRMEDRGVRLHFIHVMKSPTSVLSTYEKLADTVGAMYYQTSYPKSININTPIPAPTLTSTKVIMPTFPKAPATPAPEPTMKLNSPAGYISISEAREYDGDRTGLKMLNVHVIAHAPIYDSSVLHIVRIEGHTTNWLENVRVEIDGEVVKSYTPEIRGCVDRTESCTTINLDNGIENTGSIIIIGTFGESAGTYIGDYEMICQVLTPLEEFDYNN